MTSGKSGGSAGLGFDLTNKTLSNQDVNQFLGQSSTANPLLDLANEIQGASGTAAARGTASYGGGAGSPVLQRYSDPLGGSHSQVGWLSPNSGGGGNSGGGNGGSGGTPSNLPVTTPGNTPITGNQGGIVLGGTPTKGAGTPTNSPGVSAPGPTTTGGSQAAPPALAAALGGAPVKVTDGGTTPPAAAGPAAVSSGGLTGNQVAGYSAGPRPGTVIGPDGNVYGLPGVG